MQYYSFVFWLLLFPRLFLAINCSQEKKCRITKEHGLRTADCYQKEMRDFPKCLPSNVQVVELSNNKIRKIRPEDLARYPNIVHLYLTDNVLTRLEDETFKDASGLETLDLSWNFLNKVPSALLQLPSLKTLYLSQNVNINIAESIEDAKPISQSRLTKLDISYITEEESATDFPDFFDFPLLAFLNITGDRFNYITPRHFAGLCNLQILANANVTTDYENDCDCWKINQWLVTRNVKFSFFLCPIPERDCHDQREIEEEDIKIYEKCRAKLQSVELKILMSKAIIWIGAVVGVVAFVLIVIVYYKWSKSQRARRISERARVRDEFHLLNNHTNKV